MALGQSVNFHPSLPPHVQALARALAPPAAACCGPAARHPLHPQPVQRAAADAPLCSARHWSYIHCTVSHDCTGCAKRSPSARPWSRRAVQSLSCFSCCSTSFPPLCWWPLRKQPAIAAGSGTGRLGSSSRQAGVTLGREAQHDPPAAAAEQSSRAPCTQLQWLDSRRHPFIRPPSCLAVRIYELMDTCLPPQDALDWPVAAAATALLFCSAWHLVLLTVPP